jgi:hypothetical protein
MTSYRFPLEMREWLLSALPEDTATFGDRRHEAKYTYLPAGHARALQPDCMVVKGIRGAGKSFWCAALQDKKCLSLVEAVTPRSDVTTSTKISTGFSSTPNPLSYPGKNTLVTLLEKHKAQDIWRAVVFWSVAPPDALPSLENWSDRVPWMIQNPEPVERILYKADQDLEREKVYHLVLFDALDRSADDWKTMFTLVRGLLQVLLEFRSYKRIRPKAFLRPDHLEGAATADFPDASKILSQRLELRWPAWDLYGLLWQYLANGPNGNLFRAGCEKGFSLSFEEHSGIWTVPSKLRSDERLAKKLFHAITGEWMGMDARRGFPFTWLPNHLGDPLRQVSPRSFLAALRHAADDNPRDYGFALHYESIKKGVREASKIRVKEMEEDYPWVQRLMDPLRGMNLPCAFEEITLKWEESGVLGHLKRQIESETVKLPPLRIDEGPKGIRQDLEDLGIFQRLLDGRVNIPDVYRIGYGLGRKGGVKAAARE